MATSSRSLPAAPTRTRSRGKLILWTLMAFAAISVLFSSEIPLLHNVPSYMRSYRSQLIHDRLLFIPHALCGTIAFLVGPFQFSSRLRAKYLQLHRIAGRVYVAAVFIAGPAAIAIHFVNHDNFPITAATTFQAGLWILCTLCAFLTARNRHISQHRQWMVRSYAMTFTFVTLRLANYSPAYFNLSDADFAPVIIIGSALSAFLPDIYFNWRELTTKRA